MNQTHNSLYCLIFVTEDASAHAHGRLKFTIIQASENMLCGNSHHTETNFLSVPHTYELPSHVLRELEYKDLIDNQY